MKTNQAENKARRAVALATQASDREATTNPERRAGQARQAAELVCLALEHEGYHSCQSPLAGRAAYQRARAQLQESSEIHLALGASAMPSRPDREADQDRIEATSGLIAVEKSLCLLREIMLATYPVGKGSV